MNKSNASLLPLVALSFVLSLSAIIAVGARWSNQQTAVARPAVAARHVVTPKTVRVVMHDPGCHWFQTSAGLKKVLTVKGPVTLANLDEAALKVVGASRTKREPVGSNLALSRGTYRITMVGQAPDDNHLKLVIN